MKHTRWRDLGRRTQLMFAFLTGIQLTLAAVAWTDLALRPADEVRGPKRAWALVIGINFAGPLAYLGFGRRPMNPGEHAGGNV
ncbi:PLDc N-terminal domain-containing protein [Amycolatopsis aidingensis]|uniref:PLDc N-terminal domain-containing protein n=1 Tax=Amycolatopsis aidingensis TaxID=2842453 RepID=UPI001C0E6C53|nr:PLDc N-terminal domain-containing protein [Amycolatopsis aidingensis]